MRIWFVLLLALLLPLTAMAEDDEKENGEAPSLYERYEAVAGDAVTRFHYSRMRAWDPVEDRALVLETRRGEFWLIDYPRGCVIRPDQRILFKGTDRRPDGLTTVSRFSTIEIGDETCDIDRIRPLDPEGVKAIRAGD